MLPGQKVFAIIASILLLILIVELVRRRSLREEYAGLWLLSGVGILILSLKYELLLILTRIIGAIAPTTTLFLTGSFFLVLICLQFSVKLSKFSDEIKTLTQEIAILKNKIENPSGKQSNSK